MRILTSVRPAMAFLRMCVETMMRDCLEGLITIFSRESVLKTLRVIMLIAFLVGTSSDFSEIDPFAYCFVTVNFLLINLNIDIIS